MVASNAVVPTVREIGCVDQFDFGDLLLRRVRRRSHWINRAWYGVSWIGRGFRQLNYIYIGELCVADGTAENRVRFSIWRNGPIADGPSVDPSRNS